MCGIGYRGAVIRTMLLLVVVLVFLILSCWETRQVLHINFQFTVVIVNLDLTSKLVPLDPLYYPKSTIIVRTIVYAS